VNLSRLRPLAPLALIACLVMGCNFAQKIKEEVDKSRAPQVIKSADGKFQLTVPGGWRDDPELHEEAALKASNRVAEMYVVVISESKQDFTDEMTLEDFTELTRTNMSRKVGDADATVPASMTVNGYPAFQYTLRGTVDKFKAAYLITLVETPTSFHQIITWTLNSRYDKNFATLYEVTESFKELPAAPAAEPPPPPAPVRPGKRKS
jgi:hypothetical protein